MHHRAINRKNLILKAKAVMAAVALVVAGATAVRAADSTGALDTAYGTDGIFSAPAPSGSNAQTISIVAGRDNTTLHLVQYWASGQPAAYAITQVDANGDLVTAYGTNGTVTIPVNQNDSRRQVFKMLHLGNNAVLVFGEYTSGGTYLAKFTGSGALDPNFGTGGETRAVTNVFPSDAYDFTVSNGGYVYVWGQQGQLGRMARFDFSTGAVDNWGGSGNAANYIEAPTASNLRVIGFAIENDNSSSASVTVWGTDLATGSEKAVIGRWTMTKNGNVSNGTNSATVNTGYATNGYGEISSTVSDAKALSYSLSGNGNVYMLIGTSGNSPNRSIVAFNKSTGAAVTAFNRGASRAGVATLSNTASVIQIVTTSVNSFDRIYLLGLASQNSAQYTFVEAFDHTGRLEMFGSNGRTFLTSCPRELNPQALTVRNHDHQSTVGDRSVIVGGSNTAGYFAIRLNDGNYNPVPTCGATTVPQGGGGGGGSFLPAVSATVEEVAGPGIKVTVASLLAGARLRLAVYPDSWAPGPNMTEAPDMVEGTTGATSMTLTSVKWLPLGQGSPRTEPIQAGVTYVVGVSQTTGSSSSREVSASITIVGGAASSGSSGATTGATSGTTSGATGTGSTTAVVPGVTVTDTNVYTAAAPKKVASGSAIAVLTPAQARTSDIVSKTPSVCLPANDDLVFIDSGRCVAQVVSEKSGAVLRTLRTRVVNDEVSELKVGNEVVTLAPIFFANGSSDLSTAAKRRLRAIRDRVTAAGTVLLVGHTGVMLGDTPENRALADARAKSVAKGLRAAKAKGPFYVTPVGGADPVVKSTDREDQAKNRRVEIVLVP